MSELNGPFTICRWSWPQKSGPRLKLRRSNLQTWRRLGRIQRTWLRNASLWSESRQDTCNTVLRCVQEELGICCRWRPCFVLWIQGESFSGQIFAKLHSVSNMTFILFMYLAPWKRDSGAHALLPLISNAIMTPWWLLVQLLNWSTLMIALKCVQRMS